MFIKLLKRLRAGFSRWLIERKIQDTARFSTVRSYYDYADQTILKMIRLKELERQEKAKQWLTPQTKDLINTVEQFALVRQGYGVADLSAFDITAILLIFRLVENTGEIEMNKIISLAGANREDAERLTGQDAAWLSASLGRFAANLKKCGSPRKTLGPLEDKFIGFVLGISPSADAAERLRKIVTGGHPFPGGES